MTCDVRWSPDTQTRTAATTGGDGMRQTDSESVDRVRVISVMSRSLRQGCPKATDELTCSYEM